MAKIPRVLVGCPTYEGKAYCWSKYLAGLQALTYPQIGFLLVDNSPTLAYAKGIGGHVRTMHITVKGNEKDRIVAARNVIRKVCLEQGYDYFLSLEQDVVPQPDVIEKLLAAKKDIIGGVVMTMKPHNDKNVVVPMAWDMKDDRMFFVSPEELAKPQIRKVDVCSLSCVLISKKVLKKVTFRYEKGYDDMMFCKDAVEAGFKIYIDTQVKPKHYARPKEKK